MTADTMSGTAPPEDIAFVEFVASIAVGSYAREGTCAPFGVIGLEQGSMIVPAEGLVDLESKQEFVNILRYLSIEHAGRRSAFAMEVWTMFSREADDLRLMDEIHARGGSVSEHPRAGEAVYVICESDAGTTTREHRIVRMGDTITLEDGRTDFQEAGSVLISRGTFSNFHIPSGFQSTPEAQEYAAQMRVLVNATLQKIEPAEGPSAN